MILRYMMLVAVAAVVVVIVIAAAVTGRLWAIMLRHVCRIMLRPRSVVRACVRHYKMLAQKIHLLSKYKRAVTDSVRRFALARMLLAGCIEC